jgi:phage shock protein A
MDRLSRLVRANINDLLDRAENPELMLDQILRDMEVNIQQARGQVASMIAQEKELQADLREVRELSGEWQAKAGRAVAAAKDDLAREALRRKKDNDESAALYEQQLTTQAQTLERMKSQLAALESKYQSTMSQRDTLIARHRRAKATQKVADTISTFSPTDPSAELDRIERKIRGTEARAEATIQMQDESLESQFAELDYDSDVEAELEALKASVAKAPESLESGDQLESGSPASPGR